MRLRFATMWVAALVLAHAAPATADVSDYLGKRVASVRLESDGRLLNDSQILDLIETRVGEPLRIAAVRESVTHLFSLGQFNDVSVEAAPAGDAVALTYMLISLQQIAGFSFAGPSAPGIDRGRLRDLITERFGESPPPGRAAEIGVFIEANLTQVGYLHAHATPATESESPGHLRLVFTIAPGDRTRIGRIDVEGDPGMPVPALLHELQLSTGEPFLREPLNERIDRLLEERRGEGFYAVRLTYSTQFEDDDRTVNLTFTMVPGPHVRVVFNGDPLPEDRREEFVPVVQEGSADEDLLEDSSIRIEEYLRAQGYRDAAAPHARADTGGELVITFTVKKGPQYRVGRVDLSGNLSIPLTDLQARLRVRPGQPVSDVAINTDVAIIEDIYRSRGFAAVQVAAAVDSQDAAPGALDVPVAIRIGVVENVRTVVESVRIDGTTLPASEVNAGVGLQPGQPFSTAQMVLDRDWIQLHLANLGYRGATVSTNPGVSADGARADVVFTVHEGPRIFVDHVLIVGNVRTRTSTIERELQFTPGDPLGLEALNESQRRLAALGLFRRARITELGHGDATRRDVLVAVEEAPVTTVGYGGGVEGGQVLRKENDVAHEQLEFAPRAFFEVGRRNLFGKNRSINLFTRVSFGNLQSETNTRSGLGFGEYRVIGAYREPRVFGSSADASLSATFEQQARSSFNFTRRAFIAEVGQRLTESVSVSGNYQIQRTELFDETIDPEFRIPIDRVFPQVRLSSFSSTVLRNTRSDLTDPSGGNVISLSGQIAGRKIGSEVGFAKSYVAFQMFRLVPRTNRVVFASSVRVGLATGFPRETTDRDENGEPVLGPDGEPILVTVRDLPASERFFAGGDSTVRGFALDQLGTPETIDKDGFPTGGNGLVIFNAEFRIPVFRGFGAVGFVDVGNVFAQTSDIELRRLRPAVGFGLRYRSPIGPIRVDLGFKVHPGELSPGNRESLTALHISLGQAF